MITVRLPGTLRTGSDDSLHISTPVQSIAELIDVLDRRIPGLRDQLDDSVFNFAINDVLVLHGAREHPLADGDVVEIIPTIAGGAR
jgi:molybdopterin converting factor small subunit